MDVERLAQVLGSHHRALGVPAGIALTPGAGPAHDVSRLGILPNSKVGRMSFLGVYGQPRAALLFFDPPSRQLAIVRPARHVEVDRTVGLVCMTPFEQDLGKGDLFDDVATRPWRNGGPDHIEGIHVLEVAAHVGLDDLHGLQAIRRSTPEDLVLAFVGIIGQVPDIGDVLNVANLVPEVAEIPHNRVE